MMTDVVKLRNGDFIAEGVYQKCYKHPNNDSLCLKISKHNIEETRLSYEIKYWKKISRKKINQKDYQFFSIYKGALNTNLWIGYVFDLIKDETNNQVSKTLEYYLLNSTEAVDTKLLKSEFKKLIVLMAKYKVIANDIRAKNICCKILKNNAIQLVIIDGVGHRDFIPLVDWFSGLAQKKIHRRLIKFKLHDLDIQREELKKITGVNKIYTNIN